MKNGFKLIGAVIGLVISSIIGGLAGCFIGCIVGPVKVVETLGIKINTIPKTDPEKKDQI